MPYSSMRASRASTFHVAGSTALSFGGCLGGNSFHPAWAAPAADPTRSAPKNHASSWNFSSHWTWGTLSPHRSTDSRDVQRSYGSMTWVSVSITRYWSTSDGCMAPPGHSCADGSWRRDGTCIGPLRRRPVNNPHDKNTNPGQKGSSTRDRSGRPPSFGGLRARLLAHHVSGVPLGPVRVGLTCALLVLA